MVMTQEVAEQRAQEIQVAGGMGMEVVTVPATMTEMAAVEAAADRVK
jgi:hypothetical protein